MSEDHNDINSGVVTTRLRALAADIALSVLVIDDDELERTLIADRLTSRGIKVGECANGEQALERLSREKVPVVIVDWHMPVMDGIEFTEKFRAANIGGDTYVIMLTSRKEEFDFARGYRAGVDDYLTKGVRELELIARIHSGLHTYSLRVQLREARAALALASRGRKTGP